MNQAEVGAIILAGGASSRFGRDKATAPLGDSSMVEQVLSRLPKLRAETILVLQRDQPDPGCPVDRVVFDDPDLPDGPLRGIVAGLEALQSSWAWVVACDLPGIVPELLEAFLQARISNALGVIPEWGGRPQPLCALYARGAAPLLREAAGTGTRSVRGALEHADFVSFEEARSRKLDPTGRSFININTPDALERFRSET